MFLGPGPSSLGTETRGFGGWNKSGFPYLEEQQEKPPTSDRSDRSSPDAGVVRIITAISSSHHLQSNTPS